MTEPTPISSPPGEAFESAKRAQAQAADPALSAWVEANAGSGKTKVLIDRVARLLLKRPDGRPGAPPASILCVTYTKAAANEMLSRLFSRLGDWSIASDDALREKLAALEDRDPADYDRAALKQARSLFAQALETPGGLRIETIHAFCARILRRFPLEAGVSPGFTEIEDAEADALWQRVLETHLIGAASAHPEAIRIVSEVSGGFGATAPLDALRSKRQELAAFARRHDGADISTIAATIRKAANAPDECPETLLETAMVRDFPLGDIKAALDELKSAKRAKTDDKLFNALEALLAVTDPAERYQLYLDAIAGSSHNWPSGSNPFTKAVPVGGAVSDLFTRKPSTDAPEGRETTRMKSVQIALCAAFTAERTVALLTLGLPMIAAYAREKTLRAALDFDDLIAFTQRLLTKSHAAEWVLYKLDGGLTHILLDEAQDTSPPQWDLINALVKEFKSGLGKDSAREPRTQFVVGDPKQSIYSFQGANQEHFSAESLSFLRREEPLAIAENRPVNRPDMTMSFRSTPEVLQFVDEVRAHVPLDDDATDELPPRDADLKPHEARRANQMGRVELWPLIMARPSDAGSDWTAPPDHVPKDAPRRRLAQQIARHIRSMIDRGETVWQESADRTWARRAVRPEDILILVRSRNDLFDALIDSLKQVDLPVAGADRLKLLDNIGVQDCLNLIRFALQPADDLVLAEILRGPFCGLVDDDNHLFKLAHKRGSETLWNRLRQTTNPDFAVAEAFCANLIEACHQPAFEFLTNVLTTRDRASLSGWDKLIQRLGEPVRDPVRALISAALGHDMSEPKSLQAYLAEMERQNTELKRELGEPEDAIRVMTVHGAKGLQAPVVILPDTTSATKAARDALFFAPDGTPLYAPSSRLDCAATAALRDNANRAGERESRRLLYVAMTRASDQLIICGAGVSNITDGYGKSSWYRWCLTAMQALKGGDPTADFEAPLVYGEETALTQPFRLKPDSDIPVPSWLKQPAKQAEPPMRLAAPSRLLEDQAQVSAPFGKGRAAALRRGRLIHALLQTLPELPEDEREPYGARFLKREPDLSPADRTEMLGVTLTTLNNPEFEQIFAEGGRNEAAIVGALPGGQLVNGRVDRLVITEGQVHIIDYKTDRPAPEDLSGIGEAYIVQMAAYRAVLQQLYADRDIRCALLYTDGPRLIELPGEMMSASLNRVKSPV